MNKYLWEFNEEGKAIYESDGNDFFFEWMDVIVNKDSSQNVDLIKLFEDYLGVKIGDGVPVRVKARKGAILIVKKGNKDDTSNPQ